MSLKLSFVIVAVGIELLIFVCVCVCILTSFEVASIEIGIAVQLVTNYTTHTESWPLFLFFIFMNAKSESIGNGN